MKHVAAKLLKVIGSLSGSVSKSGYNSHQKYHYVMERDLLDAARAELVKHGLLVTMSVESVSREGDLTTVRTKHTIIDVDTGESLEIWSAGEGTDRSDKACPKAITSASKYFLLKTFLLSGDDDPENDGVTTQKQASPQQPGQSKPQAPAPMQSKPVEAKASEKEPTKTSPAPMFQTKTEVKTKDKPSFSKPKTEKKVESIFSTPKQPKEPVMEDMEF